MKKIRLIVLAAIFSLAMALLYTAPIPSTSWAGALWDTPTVAAGPPQCTDGDPPHPKCKAKEKTKKKGG